MFEGVLDQATVTPKEKKRSDPKMGVICPTVVRKLGKIVELENVAYFVESSDPKMGVTCSTVVRKLGKIVELENVPYFVERSDLKMGVTCSPVVRKLGKIVELENVPYFVMASLEREGINHRSPSDNNLFIAPQNMTLISSTISEVCLSINDIYER
uniref:Uncharacterized protein n=1 Tax=Glossina austeni TaxID=7395 RepID=A0A1A9VL62_GLOAU